MNLRRYLALLLLIASVALGTWYVVDSGRQQALGPDFDETPGSVESQSGDLNSEMPPSGAERRTESTEGADPKTASEPEAYRRALGGLRGRLIWNHTREPIPGVEIRVVELWLEAIVPTLEDLAAQEQLREPLLVKATARTDAEGRFEVGELHSRATLFLAIGLGTDKSALRLVTNVPSAGEVADLGDVALLERGTVTGRVVANEEPVVGARVRVFDLPRALTQLGLANYEPEALVLIKSGSYHSVFELPVWVKKYDRLLPFPEAVTDSEGGYVLRGVRPGASTLLVQCEGYAPATRNLRTRSGIASEPSDIKIGAGQTLRGRFVDTDGQSATAVRVTAGSLLPIAPLGFLQKPSRVNERGEFELRGLPRGKLWLCYQLADGEPWIVEGHHYGGEALVIRTAPLRSIGLRVTDDQSWPIRDVQFTISQSAEAGYLPGFEKRFDPAKHVRVDPADKDRFLLYALPAAEYRVVARAVGFAMDACRVTLSGTLSGSLPGTANSDDVKLQLVRGVTQRFSVADSVGQPIMSARIYWDSKQGSEFALSGLPVLLGKTGDDGVLTTDAIAPGATGFLCRHPAFAISDSGKQVASAGSTIRFVLQAGGHIEGRVTEDGSPPESGATIVAMPPRERTKGFGAVMNARFAAVMPDGSFRLRSLDPGTWTLEVMPEFDGRKSSSNVMSFYNGFGKRKARREVTVVRGRTSRVNIELVERGSTSGDGVLFGTVRVGGVAAVDAVVRLQVGSETRMAQVGSNGRFELSGLADGEYRVQVLRDPAMLGQELWAGRIKIIAASRVPLDLDLAVGSVEVEVRDGEGNVLPGMLLTMHSSRELAGRSAGTVPGFTRLRAITDEEGVARLRSVPSGTYDVFFAETRNAKWVLPETRLVVKTANVPSRRLLRAVRAPRLSASIEWDLRELSEEERMIAGLHKLEYLVLESAGRFVWGKIRHAGDRSRVEIDPIAPGVWRLVRPGPMGWSCEDLRVPTSGLTDARIVVRPDRARVGASFQTAVPGRRRREAKQK